LCCPEFSPCARFSPFLYGQKTRPSFQIDPPPSNFLDRTCPSPSPPLSFTWCHLRSSRQTAPFRVMEANFCSRSPFRLSRVPLGRAFYWMTGVLSCKQRCSPPSPSMTPFGQRSFYCTFFLSSSATSVARPIGKFSHPPFRSPFLPLDPKDLLLSNFGHGAPRFKSSRFSPCRFPPPFFLLPPFFNSYVSQSKVSSPFFEALTRG